MNNLQLFEQAISKNDINTVKKMIIDGFNLNCKINNKEWTPLHLACYRNQEEISDILLISGADIDAKTIKNRNAIHFAVKSTCNILINALAGIYRYKNSSDIINQTDNNGDTPLHLAASKGNKGIIWDLLIANGADPTIINNKGFTPLEIVKID